MRYVSTHYPASLVLSNDISSQQVIRLLRMAAGFGPTTQILHHKVRWHIIVKYMFAHCKWMKRITTSLQHHDLLLLCVLCLLGHDFKVPSLPSSHSEVPELSGSKWEHQSFFSGDRNGEITGVHCHFQPSWWGESFIAISHSFSCHVPQQATQEYCISIICSSVYHWIVFTPHTVLVCFSNPFFQIDCLYFRRWHLEGNKIRFVCSFSTQYIGCHSKWQKHSHNAKSGEKVRN